MQRDSATAHLIVHLSIFFAFETPLFSKKQNYLMSDYQIEINGKMFELPKEVSDLIMFISDVQIIQKN